MLDIGDLKKEIEERKEMSANSSVPSSGTTPSVASSERREELEEKMGEMKRRDLEIKTNALSRELGIGYVNLQSVSIDLEALQLIDESDAMQIGAVCFYFMPKTEIRIGTPNPNSPAVSELRIRLEHDKQAEVKLYLISQYSLDEAIKQYKRVPKIKYIGDTVEVTAADLGRFGDIKTLEKLASLVDKTNPTDTVNAIVAGSIAFNASDIHLESGKEGLVIRYRLDGMLQDAAVINMEQFKQVASRIKLLSGLKINITNKPQDGHFVINLPSGRVDVRVSTLPTDYGESIVMRILRSDKEKIRVADLGLNEIHLGLLQKEITRPNGMIVVCGPTGSGKTTTLYAVLTEVNSPEVKIVTVEDPIEYRMERVNQSQIDESKGYTFATALRSLVRQDPDIILVGEMRDQETVDIALNAALTGHLVLSTLHTNSAAGSVPRFLAMGAKPYLLAPALNFVIAQRLVRKLCPKCALPQSETDEIYKSAVESLAGLDEQLKKDIPTPIKFMTAKSGARQLLQVGASDSQSVGLPQKLQKSFWGDEDVPENSCSECHGLGYKGRIGIFEMFKMTNTLEKLIHKGEVSEPEMLEELKNQSMISMLQDGILKAAKGITTLEEVFRVVGRL